MIFQSAQPKSSDQIRGVPCGNFASIPEEINTFKSGFTISDRGILRAEQERRHLIPNVKELLYHTQERIFITQDSNSDTPSYVWVQGFNTGRGIWGREATWRGRKRGEGNTESFSLWSIDNPNTAVAQTFCNPVSSPAPDVSLGLVFTESTLDR